MKTSRLIAVLALGAVLVASPAFAQGRGGGSRSGSSSHSSSSSSRSSGGGHSSSSSSSRSSSFSSSSSRSGSSSSSRSSFSSPSSSSRSSFSGSSSTERRGSTSYRSDNSNRSYRSNGSRSSVGNPSSNFPVNRSSVRSDAASSRTNRGSLERSNSRSGGVPATSGAVGTSGRGTVHSQNAPGHTYARPDRPGHMPPSHRPMHPAPYFHHPYHHGMIHMHPIIWHPLPPRPLYWPGFWLYCNSYWYDYHVTDVVVVHKYIRDTYNVDMVSYAISGDIMYAIVNDTDGKTYLQVFDQNDKLLAEQEISSRYIKTEIDRENGGCWIFKKRDKDPMLFLYVNGELLIYEAD